MAKRRNSKWRPQTSSIYFRWPFLTYSRLSIIDLNHHRKFGANISIGGWLTVTLFKMAAVRHLGFSKMWFLTNEWPWAADFPPRYQIWCKNIDRRTNYGLKTKFKMAAADILNLLPVAIFDIPPTFHYCSQPPQNLVQYLNRRLTYATFQNPWWRPSAKLDFRKSDFWPLGVLRLLIFNHCTKLGVKILTDAQIMAQNAITKFKMAVST